MLNSSRLAKNEHPQLLIVYQTSKFFKFIIPIISSKKTTQHPFESLSSHPTPPPALPRLAAFSFAGPFRFQPIGPELALSHHLPQSSEPLAVSKDFCEVFLRMQSQGLWKDLTGFPLAGELAVAQAALFGVFGVGSFLWQTRLSLISSVYRDFYWARSVSPNGLISMFTWTRKRNSLTI